MKTDWLPTLCPGATSGDALWALNTAGAVRLPRFADDVVEVIGIASELGTPLQYYGNDAGTHPDHPAIWQVRFDHEASQRGETHAVDGGLPVHSSQSVRDPRPRYFAMLMVDTGWQDQPPGMNGKSLLVAWADAFRQLELDHPGDYDDLLDVLHGAVPWPDGRHRPVAYSLPTQRDRFDVGVRLKSDLLTHLQVTRPDDAVTHVLSVFTDAARKVAHRVQLDAHDLVIVDNDRWGHGREAIVGRVRTPGGWTVNPRELWSLTIA